MESQSTSSNCRSPSPILHSSNKRRKVTTKKAEINHTTRIKPKISRSVTLNDLNSLQTSNSKVASYKLCSSQKFSRSQTLDINECMEIADSLTTQFTQNEKDYEDALDQLSEINYTEEHGLSEIDKTVEELDKTDEETDKSNIHDTEVLVTTKTNNDEQCKVEPNSTNLKNHHDQIDPEPNETITNENIDSISRLVTTIMTGNTPFKPEISSTPSNSVTKRRGLRSTAMKIIPVSEEAKLTASKLFSELQDSFEESIKDQSISSLHSGYSTPRRGNDTSKISDITVLPNGNSSKIDNKTSNSGKITHKIDETVKNMNENVNISDKSPSKGKFHPKKITFSETDYAEDLLFDDDITDTQISMAADKVEAIFEMFDDSTQLIKDLKIEAKDIKDDPILLQIVDSHQKKEEKKGEHFIGFSNEDKQESENVLLQFKNVIPQFSNLQNLSLFSCNYLTDKEFSKNINTLSQALPLKQQPKLKTPRKSSKRKKSVELTSTYKMKLRRTTSNRNNSINTLGDTSNKHIMNTKNIKTFSDNVNKKEVINQAKKCSVIIDKFDTNQRLSKSINLPLLDKSWVHKRFSHNISKPNVSTDFSVLKNSSTNNCKSSVILPSVLTNNLNNLYFNNSMKNREGFENSQVSSELSVGFSTASRKPISVSPEKLKIAQSVFNNIVSDLDAKIDQNISSDSFKDGFTTASKKPVRISEQALVKARCILENIDDKNESSKSLENKSLEASSTIFPCGFSTASNKTVNISKEALTKAKTLFDNINNDEKMLIANDKRTIEPNKSNYMCGFSTASNKTVKISEKALAEAKLVFDNINEDKKVLNKDENCEMKTNKANLMYGFSTASNKTVKISEKALIEAKSVFDSINEEKPQLNPNKNRNSTVNTTINSYGFTTASNRTVNTSKDALVKPKTLFDTVNDDKSLINQNENHTINPNKSNFTCGFSTASNKTVSISKEALTKARIVFDSINDVQKNLNTDENRALQSNANNLSCGFSTASNKAVNINKEALTKAKNLFESINNEKPLINAYDNQAVISNINNFSTGFSTASNKTVKISEQALAKAKIALENISNETSDFENAFKRPENVCTNRSGNQNNIKKSSNNIDSHLLPQHPIRNEVSKEVCDKKLTSYVNKEKPCYAYDIKPVDIVDGFNNDINDFTCSELETIENCEVELENTENKIARNSSDYQSSKSSNQSTADQDETFIEEMDCFSDIDSEHSDSDTLAKKNAKVLFKISESKNINGFLEEYVIVREKLKTELAEIELKMKLFDEKQKQLELKASKEHKNGYLYNQKKQKHLKVKIKTVPISKYISLNKDFDNVALTNIFDLNFVTGPKIIKTPDGSVIIPSANGLIGFDEIKLAFLTTPTIDKKLTSDNWIRNHYKWIVWKLASMERRLNINATLNKPSTSFEPDVMENLICSPENILLQLKYRYDRDAYGNERSALRKILEGDESPSSRLCLMITNFDNLSNNEIELSDGWYSIIATIDRPLRNIMDAKRFLLGTKILTSNAELVNFTKESHPLQVSNETRLKIFTNSTRRCQWFTTLGYQFFKEPFIVSLSSLIPNGGIVGAVDVFIARVLPLKYLEKHADNSYVCRCAKSDRMRENKWHDDKSNLYAKMRLDIEKDFEKESKNTKKNEVIDIKNILTPETLYHAMENSRDIESFAESLTPTQRSILLGYRNKMHLEREAKIADRLVGEMQEKGFADRKVSTILEVIVVDSRNFRSNRSWTLEIFNGKMDEIGHVIKEGNFVRLYCFQTNSDNYILRNINRSRYKLLGNIEDISSYVQNLTKNSKNNSNINDTTDNAKIDILQPFDAKTVEPNQKIDENKKSLTITAQNMTKYLRKIDTIQELSSESFTPIFKYIDTIGLIVRITNEKLNQIGVQNEINQINQNKSNQFNENSVWLVDAEHNLLKLTQRVSSDACAALTNCSIGQIVSVCNLSLQKARKSVAFGVVTQVTAVSSCPVAGYLKDGVRIMRDNLPKGKVLEEYIDSCNEIISEYDKKFF